MNKLKTWELALGIGVLCAFIFGLWAQSTQQALSDKLIRLHVVANSDSPQDQELKKMVRDRTLAAADALIQGSASGVPLSAPEAEKVLTSGLGYIRGEAADEVARLGYDYPVSVSLGLENFPTREYDGFSLPAGRYTALRVTIGDGGGKNWWCVVFPPLCEAAVTESFEDAARCAGLTGDEVSLIAEQDGIRLKFKCVELWEDITRATAELSEATRAR